MDALLLNARTDRKQPTGIQIKNLVSKMLTICSLSGRGEYNRPLPLFDATWAGTYN